MLLVQVLIRVHDSSHGFQKQRYTYYSYMYISICLVIKDRNIPVGSYHRSQMSNFSVYSLEGLRKTGAKATWVYSFVRFYCRSKVLGDFLDT